MKSILNQIAEVVEIYQHEPTQEPYLFVVSGGIGISSGSIPVLNDEAFCIPINTDLFNSGCYDELLIHLDSKISSGMNPIIATNIARRYLDMI